jgi:membrane-associated protease RseP (regulator of RpoE activity)
MLRKVVVGILALLMGAAAVLQAAETGTVTKQFTVGPANVVVQVHTKTDKDAGQTASAGVVQGAFGVGGCSAATAIATASSGKERSQDRYWLGVQVAAPTEEQRKAQKIPKKHGIVIVDVIAESPAAKAGLKTNDVLLKVDGKELESVGDLIDAVQQAKEKPLKLEVLRDGKKETIEVTPAKRPAGMFDFDLTFPPGFDFDMDFPPGKEWDDLRKWLQRFRKGEVKPGEEPFRFRLFGPGVIVPPDWDMTIESLMGKNLPEDMTIVITKTGKDPAQIIVKQGDKKWEVTEKELDKLPEGVRSHVERMLGRFPFGFGATVRAPKIVQAPKLAQPEAVTPAEKPQIKKLVPAPAELESRLEKRLKELTERIEKLQQAVERLEAAQPKLRKPRETPQEKKPRETPQEKESQKKEPQEKESQK